LLLLLLFLLLVLLLLHLPPLLPSFVVLTVFLARSRLRPQHFEEVGRIRQGTRPSRPPVFLINPDSDRRAGA